MKARVGVRAVTMQQPFASAMVHGAGLFTRRGKPTTSFGEGEWIAVSSSLGGMMSKFNRIGPCGL